MITCKPVTPSVHKYLHLNMNLIPLYNIQCMKTITCMELQSGNRSEPISQLDVVEYELISSAPSMDINRWIWAAAEHTDGLLF